MASVVMMGRMESRLSALGKLRQRHEWTVVDALRRAGALTRADLVDHTGLSRATASPLVAELQRRGILEERARSPRPPSTPGRLGGAIALRTSAGAAVGIAIDRESVRAAAVDLTARVLAHHEEPLGKAAGGPEIVARCAELVRSLAAEIPIPTERIVGVGIGLPGPVDTSFGGVHPASTQRRWAGLDVRSELSRRLDGVPIFPDNDANYGALGELQYGAGRHAQNLIYLRVGPGIGGGLIINGRLYRGDDGYAGEIGHITAADDGTPWPCGRRGCLSTVASTWAIADQIQAPRLSVRDIRALARANDPRPITALRDAGTHIGRTLSALVNALNPTLIILGGDIGANSPHLLEATDRALHAHIQPIAGQHLRVVHAKLD